MRNSNCKFVIVSMRQYVLWQLVQVPVFDLCKATFKAQLTNLALSPLTLDSSYAYSDEIQRDNHGLSIPYELLIFYFLSKDL